MSLYLWFGLMVVTSSIWLLWFLYRPLQNNMFNLEKSNISLGKQKQAELERDLQQNLIDKDVFKQAKDEITQTLAIELSQTTGASTDNQQPISFWLSGLIVVFLSVASLGVYQFLTPKDAPSTKAEQTVQPAQPPSLEQSMAELKQYLIEKPDDFEAWQTLGLVSFELNDIEGSLDAYERSYQLNSKNVSMLVEYASAIATSQNDQFTGRASTLVREALEIDPNAPDALYLAGLVAANAGQFNLAKKVWQRALCYCLKIIQIVNLESILVELAQITKVSRYLSIKS
jgi:cytochrome c-type biogenesis protein CcmI